jgi:hypothetical protein
VSGGLRKVVLDAHVDQVLAAMAAARREGGQCDELELPLGREVAADLRDLFPGRDVETARVLAATGSVLSSLATAFAEGGARPEHVATLLLSVLGFAADDLNRSGLRDAEGTPR